MAFKHSCFILILLHIILKVNSAAVTSSPQRHEAVYAGQTVVWETYRILEHDVIIEENRQDNERILVLFNNPNSEGHHCMYVNMFNGYQYTLPYTVAEISEKCQYYRGGDCKEYLVLKTDPSAACPEPPLGPIGQIG